MLYISSPQHFAALKTRGAIFSVNGNMDYFKSRSIQKIEPEWSEYWKLYYIDTYQDLWTWEEVKREYEEIVSKKLLFVWHLSKNSWNGSIPSVFSWKQLNSNEMLKLREKMRLVWQEIDFIHQDFVTWQSIKFDMGIDGKLLSNIYWFYLRSFLSRISTWMYKITEKPIRRTNTSLTGILEDIKLLGILDEDTSIKLEADLIECLNIQRKIWSHSRNILIWHMDFDSHRNLSVVDEGRRITHISWVRVDNSWLDDLEKLQEIYKYWLNYIFSITYQPNISSPHDPQELDEYEYRLFLTVFQKETWEQINVNN